MPSNPKRSHHKKVAPKRSHQKKPVATTRSQTLTPLASSGRFQFTATTFWKMMEPEVHEGMQQLVDDSGKQPGTEEYKAVVRRAYRAVILSASTFFIQATKPSQAFMNQQGTQALCKAIKKSIFEAQGDNSGFDDDLDCR